MRKQALLALAATGLALGATACGDDGTGGAVDLDGKKVAAMADYRAGQQFKASEPVEFSLLYSDHPNYPIKDDWLFWKELKERTNVTLKPTVVPMSDYEQKRSLVVGAGDAPWIISKTYPGQEQAFVAAFRTDELRRLGLAEPETWDEVHDVLKAIKAAHPDGYPLSDRFEGKSILNYAAQAFGTHAGWEYRNTQWRPDEGRFVFTGSSPEQKQLVEYFHELVAEGLMDPESFTQKDEPAIQKLANGKSYAISTLESDKFVAMVQFVDWLWYSDEGCSPTAAPRTSWSRRSPTRRSPSSRR
ncbi:extracellular solute-binding protein [Saccharothrix syringae]|uniref:extracellular solute-binding protein n=1 Tax=Saccharothrix syringae TaxID=103733 RepID=UPI00052770D7|nr:extracellular solute-binding protein [Saccharothrix syringae]